MFKSLIAEFFAFLAFKNDERYHELELRIQQLEQERNQLTNRVPQVVLEPFDVNTEERIKKLEKRVFWEKHW